MKQIRLMPLATVVAHVLLVTAGCGSGGVSLAEVTGTVTVDGQPVPGLEVSFEPQGGEGGTSLGYTGADGRYELFYAGGKKGAVIGPHRVQVNPSEMDEGDGLVTIPPRYNAQSELNFEVKSGSNAFDIAITRR